MARLPPGQAYFGTDQPEGALPPVTPTQGGQSPAPPTVAPEGAIQSLHGNRDLLGQGYEQDLATKAGIQLPDPATASPQELQMALQALAEVAATDAELELIDALAEEWMVMSPHGESFGPQAGMDLRQMENARVNASPETAPMADMVEPELGADLRYYPSGGRNTGY